MSMVVDLIVSAGILALCVFVACALVGAAAIARMVQGLDDDNDQP